MFTTDGPIVCTARVTAAEYASSSGASVFNTSCSRGTPAPSTGSTAVGVAISSAIRLLCVMGECSFGGIIGAALHLRSNQGYSGEKDTDVVDACVASGAWMLGKRRRQAAQLRRPAREAMKPPASPCPAESALAVIGGRWKILILYRLFERPHRFSELKRALGGCTQKM